MEDTTRVPLVFPRNLWEEVKRLVPSGQRSQVVAGILEEEISRRRQLELLESIGQFQAYLLEKYGEMPSSVDDIHQMREERDAEIKSLR